MENVLKSFTGNTVELATEKGRNWHCEAWNFLIIRWSPVIILMMFSNPLKHGLCNYFCENGHTVIPSGEEAKHLVRWSNKPIPTLVLISGLIDAGVDFIRIISFGMKKLDTFPAIPRDLHAQNAVDHGFPPNEWGVSLSRRTITKAVLYT
jgi:hypothetical protein